MERKSGLTVATIGLLTAVVGLLSSPVWAPPVCRAIGVCIGTDGGNGPSNADGGDDSNKSGGDTLGTHEDSRPPAGKRAADPQWACPGARFCAWDDRDGGGAMIVEKDSTCSTYDIGSAGLGDRVSSYQNRTGVTVGLYNWTGQKWDLLVQVADGDKGTLPASADKQTDAVKICD